MPSRRHLLLGLALLPATALAAGEPDSAEAEPGDPVLVHHPLQVRLEPRLLVGGRRGAGDDGGQVHAGLPDEGRGLRRVRLLRAGSQREQRQTDQDGATEHQQWGAGMVNVTSLPFTVKSEKSMLSASATPFSQ